MYHSKNQITGYCLLLLIVITAAWSCKQQTAVIRFELDMRPAIAEGWFTPDEDQVGLRGDQQPLSWSETYMVNAAHTDGIYSLKIPFSIVGDSLELSYKIKTEGAGHSICGRRGQWRHLGIKDRLLFDGGGTPADIHPP